MHQVSGFDCAEFCHFADVVAPQVDQHQMFGKFLFIAEQVCRECFVFRGSLAARAGAGNGTGFHYIIGHFHHKFGRRPHQLVFAEINVEQIGRGIEGTECAIGAERIGVGLKCQPLGQDHLKRFTFGDKFFYLPHLAHKAVFTLCA